MYNLPFLSPSWGIASSIQMSAVLPAAAERLLSHWKVLDRHAEKKGDPPFSVTLQGMLQLRVSRGEAGIDAIHNGSEDLCQSLLSSYLSSNEALSRPSLDRSATTTTSENVAPNRMGLSKSNRHPPTPPPDDELVGRVIRAYRVFARVRLFGDSIPGSASSNRGGSSRNPLFVAVLLHVCVAGSVVSC